ncbi:MAG: hypothetical protein JNK85_05135 [Verrucomicrobiales bacterium]|nr:hypothetical protein [Verrucomicrobiales bacterium]
MTNSKRVAMAAQARCTVDMGAVFRDGGIGRRQIGLEPVPGRRLGSEFRRDLGIAAIGTLRNGCGETYQGDVRLLLALLLIWLSAMPGTAASRNAQVRLFCLSLKVEPGVAREFGLESTLTFTSSDFASPNHEFYPLFEDDLTHATIFRMESAQFPEPLLGEMALLAPDTLDGNTNGIPDLYEVAVGVPSTTLDGLWISDLGRGTAQATWHREAGQLRGSVKIQMTSDEFGVLPAFTHAFEILEYGGTLSYVPETNAIRGTVDLKRVGIDAQRLSGPMIFTREATNRFRQFAIGESQITNELGQVVGVSLGEVERDTDYSMDFFGAMAFANGDPATPEIDYELFYIGINDPNDTDGDGISDLTDDVEAPPPPPSLTLRLEGADARLTLKGAVGVTYTLQRSGDLMDPEAWINDRTIRLETASQEVTVPLGNSEARFWRLRWP